MFSFDDFEQLGALLVQKSRFFSSSSELHRISDPSRSEAANSCFFFAEKPCSECCKNTPHIDHQSIIARRYNVKNRAQNAANFFRKITILSIVSTMNTGRFVKRVVHFYDFDWSGRCSLLMILSSSEHFWFKKHDFSARASNCLVYVIVAVQNMKIHVFRKVSRIYRFLVNILRFL